MINLVSSHEPQFDEKLKKSSLNGRESAYQKDKMGMKDEYEITEEDR